MEWLDGDPIIGPWTGGLENFQLAVGFSGIGPRKALASYQTIDLSRFSYHHIVDEQPVFEVGFTAQSDDW